MGLFWVFAVVLIAGVLVMILPALLRPNSVAQTSANAERREIFRQQFDEIEQDKINGVLDVTQYDMAKSEMQRRMLDEIGLSTTADIQVAKADTRLAIILIILLPIAAFLIYFKIGNPASILITPTSPELIVAQKKAEQRAMAGDIEPLLNTLKSKLEQNPGDGTGWALLARSYVEIKRHAEAVLAYEKAVKATPDDPQLLADYADALAVVNGYSLAGKPELLIKQALKLDPHNTKALMLAATAAFDGKDYQQAISFWQRLQKDLPADSDILPEVNAALNEAYVRSGKKLPVSKLHNLAPAANAVTGVVRIAPALAGKIDPAATVFIFARATQGPPMPVAIERTTAKNLPYTYKLDDSSAMSPDHKLSLAGEVILLARISKSGDAKPQAGDLQGMSAALKPDGRQVDIEINQVVP